MKFLAALGALFGAATTANGYRPQARDGYGSIYSFSSGLIVTELPLRVLAAQAAALAAVSRWLSPRVRWFAWLVSGLSWLGLIGLERSGRRAYAPLTSALDAELGIDRQTTSVDLWSRPVGTPAKAPGAFRMLWINREYASDRNIAYGDAGSRNSLDIWRRPDLDRGGRAPVLLQVHGGAWMVGSKEEQAHPLMSHLAELGWVCVSINYRLSPRATWPDHIVDVKRAIAWTKEHIADYGGDPDWIAITGGSAGGHLAALAALTPGVTEFQPGFEDVDTSVQAAVPYYGVYDLNKGGSQLHSLLVPTTQSYVFKQSRSRDPELFRIASPVSHVSADAPPFFILHGSNDTLVPVQQGRDFAEQLRAVSRQPVVYAELPTAQHAFDIFSSPRARHAAVAVEQFLAEAYVRDRTAAEPA